MVKRAKVIFWLAFLAGLCAGVGAGATLIDGLWGTGAELEEVYRRGHNNGYAAGYEDGFADGQNASISAPTPNVDYMMPPHGLPYTWGWFVGSLVLAAVSLFLVMDRYPEM